MPMNKYFHILCTSGNKVIYEGRFQCATRGSAMTLLKEKIGRQNLCGLVYTITEFPIEVLKEVIESIMNNKPLPEGDIVSFQEEETSNTSNYSKITNNKRNPNKPKGVAGVRRRLGDL